MPKLPDQNSLPDVMPEADRPMATYTGGIAATGTEAVGDAYARAGQVGQQAALQDLDIQDQVNKAAAESTFLSKKMDLDQQFRSDPDYATAPKRYAQALQQALAESASTIQGNTARAEFQTSLGRVINGAQDSIVANAYAKGVDVQKGALIDRLNNNAGLAARATDDLTAGAVINASQGEINAAVNAGYMSHTEGAIERQRWTQSAVDQRFTTQVKTDPVGALKVLDPTQIPVGQPGAALLAPDLSTAINSAASAHGVNPGTLTRVAQLESGGNAGAVNPATGAAGPFQFTSDTAKQYGLNDATDIGQSADAAARLMADNKAQLTKSLGREPTEAELYLAHQQGAAGATALIQNPNENAVVALTSAYNGDFKKARAAVLGNGGSADMTAGDFAKTWETRFGTPQPSVSSAGSPGTDVPPVTFGGPGAASPKQGGLVDLLPPLRRAELISEAQRGVREQSAAGMAAAKTLYTGEATAIDQRGRGTMPSQVVRNQLVTAYGPANGGALADDLDMRTKAFADQQTVALTSPDEDKTILGKYDQSTSVGYDANTQTEHDNVAKMITAKQQALGIAPGGSADPAGWIAQHSPYAAELFQAAQADPKKLPAALGYLDAQYDRLGVPDEARNVFPTDQAKAIVAKIGTGDPKAAADGMAAMESQYGASWPRVYRDLSRAGLPPSYQVVGAVDDPAARTQLVEALRAKPKDLEANISGDDKKTIDQGVYDATAPLLQTLGASRAPNSGQTGDAWRGAVQSLAYRYASQGLSGSDALVKASNDLIGNKWDFAQSSGMAARAPKGTLPAVETYANDTLAKLKPGDVWSAMPSAVPLTTDQKAQAYLRDGVKNGSLWVTAPSGDGWTLLDSARHPVLQPDGRTPIGFKFSDAVAAAQGVPKPASDADSVREPVMLP